MLMYSENGGFHNFPDSEVEQAKKDGWVDGAPVRAAALAAKARKPAPIALAAGSVTMEPHARRGRPRKVEEVSVIEAGEV